MRHLLELLAGLLAMALWGVFGFLVWVPAMVRVVFGAALAGVLAAATGRDTDASESIESVAGFYGAGFATLWHAISGDGPPRRLTRVTGEDLLALLGNVLFAALFWTALFLAFSPRGVDVPWFGTVSRLLWLDESTEDAEDVSESSEEPGKWARLDLALEVEGSFPLDLENGTTVQVESLVISGPRLIVGVQICNTSKELRVLFRDDSYRTELSVHYLHPAGHDYNWFFDRPTSGRFRAGECRQVQWEGRGNYRPFYTGEPPGVFRLRSDFFAETVEVDLEDAALAADGALVWSPS